MSRQTSFAHQKKVLERLSSLLEGSLKEMESLHEKYATDIFSLYEEDGLMEEIYQDYKNLYINTLGEDIASLISRVREEHLAFVEKEIDFISSR